MGGRPAFRTLNQPRLPTELQVGAGHAQESTKPSLFVYLGFFCPQVGDVHSRWWNDDSIKEKDILQQHLESLCESMLAILKTYCPSFGNETVLSKLINKCLCWPSYLSLSSQTTSFILMAFLLNSAKMTNVAHCTLRAYRKPSYVPYAAREKKQ